MSYLVMLVGLFLGFIFFTFTFIVSKRSARYYLAPVITFLVSGIIVAYSLFFVGGFEGMGYLFIAGGFFTSSVIGTVLLPLLTRRIESKQLNKRDKVSLMILLIVFFATIGFFTLSEKNYWIIEYTSAAPVETDGYRISTISEGNKEVTLLLGEKYLGKEIEVENVDLNESGSTEITLKFVEGGNYDKVPYIQIGIKEINEPLKVQTTDGVIFNPIGRPRN